MEPQPYLTVVGPDKHGIISQLHHATGMRHPIIAARINSSSKPQVEVARILPNNLHRPFGTASYSSMSGSVRINIQGLPEVKMEQSYEGMNYAKVFKALPAIGGNGGKLRWKAAGWGNVTELWDEQGVKLASFRNLSLKNDPQLDVYVQASNVLVDVMILGSLGLMVEDKKSIKFLGEMIGAIRGG